MKIKRFIVGPLQQNTFVASDESTGQAVMIDCGALFEEEEMEIARYIKEEGLELTHLLLTHAHFDHACGVPFVWHVFGIGAEFCREDEWLYYSMSQQIKRFLRADIAFDMPSPAGFIAEGDTVAFGQSSLTCIATPGHTPGGLSFYSERDALLFGGDSLFPGSIGRTDFERSDTDTLISSLRSKVLTLPPETIVYTGHGSSTTVGDEARHNPYLA